MQDFESSKLAKAVKQAVKNKGYTKPTPIQAQSIPYLLEGKDLLGIAQTGTGKTAAFSLPILTLLSENKNTSAPKNARCLILTPTRELASQIEANIEEYGKGLGLTSLVVFGGVGKSAQVKGMKNGIDILVATPGRLLDLINERQIAISDVEIFVLDEADRMLDMGFLNDVKKVIKLLPRERQTLLFSATMPSDIASLANSLLKSPKKVEVTPESTTVEKIDQKAHYVAKLNKPNLLKDILSDDEIESMLVFTRTKYGADRIVKKLEQANIEAAAIHSNKSQNQRERALGAFRESKIRVLVATDIAARGIDIPQVSHVVNYDPPEDPKSYVHRIGRTGRAGADGVAILFCDEDQVALKKDIEKHIKMQIPLDINQRYHEDYVLKAPARKGNRGGARSGNRGGQGSGPNKKRPSNSKKARRRRSFKG